MAIVTFGPLRIAYDAGVLTPRPWTLEQARWAVEVSSTAADGPLLELCCGAGQIGLVAAVETGRALVQVDDDETACRWARHNAARAGVASDVRCAPLEAALGPHERFPVVVADPPYVATDDARRLTEDPAHAVDGGADGLAVARRCLAVAAGRLVAGGHLLLQTRGSEQASTLAREAAAHAVTMVEVRVFGDDRAVALFRRG